MTAQPALLQLIIVCSSTEQELARVLCHGNLRKEYSVSPTPPLCTSL
jgi:hypothetical protein